MKYEKIEGAVSVAMIIAARGVWDVYHRLARQGGGDYVLTTSCDTLCEARAIALQLVTRG